MCHLRWQVDFRIELLSTELLQFLETGTYSNILIGTVDTTGTAVNFQRANYQTTRF
jgi:hypothetical protein